MRLLYLTRACTIHDRRFLRAFARNGVEIALLTLQDCAALIAKNPLPDRVRSLGDLDLRPGASTRDLNHAMASFDRLARSFAPSLVLSGPVHDAGYLAAGSDVGSPLVMQPWAFDVLLDPLNNASIHERCRVALRAATALFADSAAVVRACELLAGKAFTSTYRMPWGVELEELRYPRDRSEIRRELGLANTFAFVCTRRMEPIYGVDTVLEAFRKARELNIDATLLWAASGSLRPSAEAFVRVHGLANAVHLFGDVSHQRVLELFAAADGYVSCAASDGTSISLLEAMFFGLPVIVSDLGGNPEWVGNERNGWLVPHEDPAAFAQAMAKAAAMPPGQRRQMAATNNAIVVQRADWDANFPGFLTYLSQLAK